MGEASWFDGPEGEPELQPKWRPVPPDSNAPVPDAAPGAQPPTVPSSSGETPVDLLSSAQEAAPGPDSPPATEAALGGLYGVPTRDGWQPSSLVELFGKPETAGESESAAAPAEPTSSAGDGAPPVTTPFIPPRGVIPPAQTPAGSSADTPPTGQPVVTTNRGDEASKQKKRRGAAVVGVIGELFITVGVLLGLYVVWELVWTDVQAGAEVKEILKQTIEQPDWVEPLASTTAPLHDPTIEPPPVDADPLATPAAGQVWATIHVPRWGLDYNVPIAEGVSLPQVLNRGMVGHYVGTEGPGRIGNFATAGHRTTYSKPYNRVAELKDGDSLIVETAQYYFVYKVYGRDIVYPQDTWVIWPVPTDRNAVPTKRLITLTTCHPMFSAAQRYVIWGEMAYWVDKSEGTLAELEG